MMRKRDWRRRWAGHDVLLQLTPSKGHRFNQAFPWLAGDTEDTEFGFMVVVPDWDKPNGEWSHAEVGVRLKDLVQSFLDALDDGDDYTSEKLQAIEAFETAIASIRATM